MHRSFNLHSRVLWITRTALLMALLVTLQWATSGFGQFVTGSCVNAVLAVSALLGGVWSGVAVALVSPFFAFMLGIGPKLVQIVPCIALGNLTYVLLLYFLLEKKHRPVWQQLTGMLLSAVAKFAVLYILVVKVVVPVMGDTLKPQQVKTFSAMFSWPQLVTAIIGGAAALLLLPLLRKALKRK